MLAVNIATLGMSSSAAAPASQSLKIGEKVYEGTSKVGKAFVTVVNKLKSIPLNPTVAKGIEIFKKIYNPTTKEVIKTIKTIYKIGKLEYDATKDYFSAFAEDFINQTSPEINQEIDNRFNPQVARFIKESWGNVQLDEMSISNGFNIAGNVLSAVSIVDPTGIASVINAFAKPVCQDVVSFPNLSRSYK